MTNIEAFNAALTAWQQQALRANRLERALREVRDILGTSMTPSQRTVQIKKVLANVTDWTPGDLPEEVPVA